MSAFLYPALALTLAVGGCATTQPDASDLTAPGSPDRGVPYPGPETADAQTAGLDAVPTGEVRIALGEAVAVEAVPIRFDAVTEDSRCPPDVSCVWAGRAHVRLLIGGEAVELNVPGYGPNDTVPDSVTRSGLTVRVLSMTPTAPSAPAEGGPEPQWVELDVTRAER